MKSAAFLMTSRQEWNKPCLLNGCPTLAELFGISPPEIKNTKKLTQLQACSFSKAGLREIAQMLVRNLYIGRATKLNG